jgi:Putative zinc-finger
MPHKLKEWRDRLPCANGHKENLSAYLDGELDLDLRSSLEEHLAACARCRARYEELRFASRAMSHFVVPQARVPAWQATAHPSQQSTARTALERFWKMKINLPAPVAATVALALVFCVAALLFMGRLQSIQTSVDPLTTTALAPQIKFIEVPVERERVVTRTVYAPARGAARPAGAAQPDFAANRSRRAALIAEGARREQDARGSNGELPAATSLAGFRPATDANLRIVKEPEQ